MTDRRRNGDPIPLTSVAGRVPLTPEAAVELEIKKVGGLRTKRAVAQAHNRVRDREMLDGVTEAVESAIESRAFKEKSVEELSELIVRRFAKVTLLGGPMFMPTNLKEVTEAAANWSKIATQSAVRAGRIAGEEEGAPGEAAAAMRQMVLKARAAARSQARRKSAG